MPRIKLKQVDGIGRKNVSDAFTAFMHHCHLKNLSLYSIKYYKENIQFFLDSMPQVKYVEDITQERIDEFVSALMDKGNRVTAINARLRGAFVFLRYCFEQEDAESFPLSLMCSLMASIRVSISALSSSAILRSSMSSSTLRMMVLLALHIWVTFLSFAGRLSVSLLQLLL